jgi:hypothetical protein
LSVVYVDDGDREPLAEEVDDDEHDEEEDRIVDFVEVLEGVECASHQVRKPKHHQVCDQSVPDALLELSPIAGSPLLHQHVRGQEKHEANEQVQYPDRQRQLICVKHAYIISGTDDDPSNKPQ